MELSRRRFLRDGFALGGIFAASRLPLHARGDHEQLSLAYSRINAGATKPFSVLHISDTHLTFADPHEEDAIQKYKIKRTELFGGRQYEALKDSIRWAKLNADYLIHTGDLIDWGSEANLRAVKEAFGSDTGPVFGAIGNHEYFWPRDNGRVPRHLCFDGCSLAYPYNLCFSSQVINGVNFVSIDDSDYNVSELQIKSFAREVQKGLPIILLTHVPFHTPEITAAKRKFHKFGKKFRNDPVEPFTFGERATRFIEYLKKEPLLKGILAGHLHITAEEQFSPTAKLHVVAGNFGFAGREILIV